MLHVNALFQVVLHIPVACPCNLLMLHFSRSMSILHIYVACPCCTSTVHVNAECPSFMSMLFLCAVCLIDICPTFFMFLLYYMSAQHAPVNAAFYCAFPCCMPVLHVHAVCPCCISMSMLHVMSYPISPVLARPNNGTKAQARSGPPGSAKAQARRPKKRMPNSGCYSVLLHLTEQTLAQKLLFF
jgi:hypothetical protein